MFRVIKMNVRRTFTGEGYEVREDPETLIIQTDDFDHARRVGMTWARDNGLLTTTHTYNWVEGTPAGQVWVLRSQNSWTDVQIIRTESVDHV